MSYPLKMQRPTPDGFEEMTAHNPQDEVNLSRAGFSAGVSLARLVAAEKKPDPLDHDGDGRKGGSPAGERATARRSRRRR